MRCVICVLCFCLVAGVALPQYTVTNPSFDGNILGWEIYQCTASYQTINSPWDPVPGSGSALITADATLAAGSFSQGIGINANGQTLTIYADIAWDGDWDKLCFGFYEENVWDRIIGASVNIADPADPDYFYVPPDTDGTLDSFARVEASGTLTTTGNPVRVWIGSACTDYGIAGPKTLGVSKYAIDNVSSSAAPTPTPTPTPFGMAIVSQCWEMYE
jgi:hypothetical protein